MKPHYRGSDPDAARKYRQAGHDNALLFALLIGLETDYSRDPKAKKDVIDPAGDAHSVKAGERKWQLFLYSRNRFIEDDGFQALNGVGQLLIHCIDTFPPRYADYKNNKELSKERLKTPMKELKDRFQRKQLLRAFLRKSIFNGGEVDYMTILRDDQFYVYWNDDVVKILADGFTVENSKARTADQFDEQKVLFKYDGKNVGELEMRNDSESHYQQVRFNMNKAPCLEMLDNENLKTSEWADGIIVCGSAIKKFGKW